MHLQYGYGKMHINSTFLFLVDSKIGSMKDRLEMENTL